MHPEEKARLIIDEKLVQSGYIVQDFSELDLSAGLGVVVREYATSSGPADYLIFIDKKPVGIIEAKAHDKGALLLSTAEQTKRYAESKLKYIKGSVDIRFAYEATDVLTYFCDYHDEEYSSREVFSFHQPEQLKAWIDDDDTLRNRMKHFPEFDPSGFRDCQTRAIVNLEKSFSNSRQRSLVQMATGAGKTYTAITNTYRLLKHAKAKRILFLVDTKNLGEQAEEEFRRYRPTDDARLFPELYNVCRLSSSSIPPNTDVCISTIQRMYSILRQENLDESLEEVSQNELTLKGGIKDVVYNKDYPPEYFDFVIIDECHRSIYNVWQQVLDYFDAFLIGLTATPDKRTFAFFEQNIVSEYTHEEAVVDGVNVGGDIYLIETDISKNGAVIVKQVVEKRDRLSRKKRWEQIDEDIQYASTSLDRDIVNPSQIRTVIRAFKDKVTTEIFPGRKEVPKTLIFAKTDSHADDIIKIVREEFGKGNEFCKKVTYQADNPQGVLADFRNDYNPRIAVTVDMIATGTDVRPLECLLFMRDVKSKNYFEQMLGRGRRVLSYEDLQRVSPSATSPKISYAIVDAIGVTKSLKTETRPLDRKPSVSMAELMNSVAVGARDDDTVTTLASRLLRLNAAMTETERQKASELAGGIPINLIAKQMLDAFDEDVAEEKARTAIAGEPTEQDLEKAFGELVEEAVAPFSSSELRNYLENVRKAHDQIIDNTNIDKVLFLGWDENHQENAEKAISTFRKFIEENKAEIEALEIIYTQSYATRPLTFEMIKQMYAKLQEAPYRLSNEMLWNAYEITQGEKVSEKSLVNKLVDIIALLRFELGQSEKLVPFKSSVDSRFRDWVFAKNAGNIHFTDEQMQWLRMVRDHIAISAHIETDDLELTPFDDEGGLGKFYVLFGGQYQNILDELNYALVA